MNVSLRSVLGALHNDSLCRERSLEQLVDAAERSRSKRARATARIIARALVTDANESVRLKATEALGEVGNRRDFHALQICSQDSRWEIRASAYSSMASAAGRVALTQIRTGLSDPNPIVRRYAAVALFDVSGCAAQNELKELSDRESNKAARVGILYGLSRCGDTVAAGELKALCSETDPHVSSAAAELLRELPLACK